MGDRLRFRRKLTEGLARALTEFAAKEPEARLERVRVSMFNTRDELLARMPLAEAVNATTFDLTTNGRAGIDWREACDVEIDDHGDDE